MRYSLLLLVFLAALALAVTQQGFTYLGATVSGALQPAHFLSKRVDYEEAITDLASLMRLATKAVDTGSTCSSECQGWISDLKSCGTATTEEEIGRCACGSDALGSMATCGSCFHVESDVSDGSELCKEALEGASGRTEVSVAASAFAFAGAVGVIWLA